MSKTNWSSWDSTQLHLSVSITWLILSHLIHSHTFLLLLPLCGFFGLIFLLLPSISMYKGSFHCMAIPFFLGPISMLWPSKSFLSSVLCRHDHLLLGKISLLWFSKSKYSSFLKAWQSPCYFGSNILPLIFYVNVQWLSQDMTLPFPLSIPMCNVSLS